MKNLPSGTVTFLFTDIEGSTKLAQQYPKDMPTLLARHNEILNQTIEAHNGFIFRIVGDSYSASFHNANDALLAALASQQKLLNEPWSPAAIKVRMGLHTGAAQFELYSKENNYSGYETLALTQRIMSAGHGGQILLSQSTYELLRGRLPEKFQIINLGEQRLKDILRPERLYQLKAPGLPPNFPPLKTLENFPNNLPFQLTSFVGREKEIDEIRGLLKTSHLVTLTGSGGTGKTRLSIEVGTQLLTNFQHGVWLIELAPLSDESQIIPALAQTFGLQELPFNPLKNLVMDYLRDKKLLLILDNCEHLIAACAKLTDELLHQCAGLKILASSREALGIAGEVAYRTPSLADTESTSLFVERARAANSKFFLTESNASAVAQICHRLDGIPLAIELAAARTKLLAPEQIATRLDDLFRLLVGGSRTALPRQQTLRALIDWSYDLLTDEEKNLLRIASVFVGGWTLEALEAVSEDSLAPEHLEGLINKSLVVTEEHNGEMRYFLLETIRQYAREKLFEAKQAGAARDRHFVHYKNISSGLWDVSRFTNEAEMQKLKSMQVEVENLRAAFEWGLQNDVQSALELAANMAMSMTMLGRLIEGTTILKIAMEKFRALPPVEGAANRLRKEIYAHGCFGLGTLLQGSNEIMSSRSALQEAIAIARELGDKKLLGVSLEMYANASAMIKAEDALAAAQEGLEILRELNYKAGMGMAYGNLARLESIHGNYQEAEKYIALFLPIMGEGTISLQSGFLNLGMGIGARSQGRFDRAQRHFEEGLRIFTQMGHKGMITGMTSEIAHTQRALGNYSAAKNTYRGTIKLYQDYGNRPAVAHQLECFAMIAVVEEEPQRAAKLFATAKAIREVRVINEQMKKKRKKLNSSVDSAPCLLKLSSTRSGRKACP